MSDLDQVCQTGDLTKDPELRETGSGTSRGARAARKRSAPTSEELRALCAQGVRRLQSEHGFRQWLSAMRTLHRYSPWNVLWLIAQREGLTHVASYRRWQRLGYQVRGGERGLTVWVPMRARPG